jgi:hypothetical protein
MSIPELAALTRKHWRKYRPQMVKELRETGELNEAIHGAASLALAEIDRLMKQGYQEHEAREVALRAFILLPAEPPDEDDEQERELAEKEAWYQKYPPVPRDEDE